MHATNLLSRKTITMVLVLLRGDKTDECLSRYSHRWVCCHSSRQSLWPSGADLPPIIAPTYIIRLAISYKKALGGGASLTRILLSRKIPCNGEKYREKLHRQRDCWDAFPPEMPVPGCFAAVSPIKWINENRELTGNCLSILSLLKCTNGIDVAIVRAGRATALQGRECGLEA